MAAFLLWLPRERSPDAAELPTLGLGWLEPTGHTAIASPGPGGDAGRLIALNPSHSAGHRPRCRYRADSQVWHQAPHYWFGWDSDDPPRPADLQRATIYFGHPAQLGDDQLWTVPIIHAHGRKPFQLAADGETWFTSLPDDPELVAGCARYWDWRWGGGAELTRSDIVNLCVRALSMHYRLDRPQCSSLGLFDDYSIDRCLGAMFDVPSLAAEVQARKKKEAPATPPNGSTSTDGIVVAGTPDPSPSPTGTGKRKRRTAPGGRP